MSKAKQAAKQTPRKRTQPTSTSAPVVRKLSRPPLEHSLERERWDVQMRPDLVKELRLLGITRDCSPYDVLEDAVAAYLRDHSKR